MERRVVAREGEGSEMVRGEGRREKNPRGRGLQWLLGEEIDLGFLVISFFQTGPPLPFSNFLPPLIIFLTCIYK
jgi:hypothetical protein